MVTVKQHKRKGRNVRSHKRILKSENFLRKNKGYNYLSDRPDKGLMLGSNVIPSI